ncbi:MAG: 5-bromo-4-chloroindolyl phosphate hydrolysis family protein [Rhodobacteraceae bacterium]|nr:5-bromo-4-chloroindolyl phosphate hydrolysis family protein [Paracoccaceae bacterium]
MAERFGGKFSPEGATKKSTREAGSPFAGAKPASAGARVNLLFVAPLPLVFSFGSGPTTLAVSLAALGMLLLAAWLTREGLKAEDAYNARTIAKRPALPRKMVASALIGGGLAMASFLTSGIIGAAVIGLIGVVLHVLAFGLDPLRDKGAEGIDQFQQDRVARVVDEAEKHLGTMARAIEDLKDRGLERRLESFQATARKMFRTVEEDPRDLTAARKFLGVYLMGARDATLKFADLYGRQPEPADREKYLALLDDLEGNFVAKTDKLMNDNRTDMDIEIKVLRDRLAREGVTTKEG